MLFVPGNGILAPEWRDLSDKIVNGDGLGWPGDPRLELRIGVIEYKGRTGRRLEVWRANEDGSETPVAHWRPDHAGQVCFDLAKMRVDRPGFSKDDACTRIDRHNDAIERKNQSDWNDIQAELSEYVSALYHDTTGPRTTFRQIPGRRDVGN